MVFLNMDNIVRISKRIFLIKPICEKKEEQILRQFI